MKTLTQIQTEAREKMFSILNPERFTATDYLNIGGMLDSLISTAYQLGKDAATIHIEKNIGALDKRDVEENIFEFDVDELADLLAQARSV